LSWLDPKPPPGPCPICRGKGCKVCDFWDVPSPTGTRRLSAGIVYDDPELVADGDANLTSHLGRQAFNPTERTIAVAENKAKGKKRRRRLRQ